MLFRSSRIAKEGTAWVKSHLKEFTEVFWATKANNKGSQVLAEKNGWKVVRDDDEWKTYSLKGIKKPITEFADIFNESADISNNPKVLSKWMRSNIHYANFTKLKSHDEVLKTKCGSCHDQVMFELEELKGIGAKAIFLMEYNDVESSNAVTHSFVYYINKGKYYWFENAWSGQEGIHEFNSHNEMIQYIRDLHDEGKFGNVKQYPKLFFTNFGKHTPGETLSEFVTKCIK